MVHVIVVSRMSRHVCFSISCDGLGCEMFGTVKRPTRDEIVFRHDVIGMVDWGLKSNHLPTYLF